MTTATFSRLPLSAGGAIAGSLAKGGYWTLSRLVDVGALAARQFMRAPVAISVVAAIAALSVLAGANALYFQTSRHPAPLFFAPVKADVPAVKPVIPATRPRPQQQSQLIDNDTTGSLGTAPSTAAIGNGEVLALQKKLASVFKVCFFNFDDGLTKISHLKQKLRFNRLKVFGIDLEAVSFFIQFIDEHFISTSN